MKRIGWISYVVFVFLLTASFMQAEDTAVPAAVNYQGMLTNPNDGNPVPPGVYQVEFRIWDDPTDTGGNHLVWGRSFSVHVMPNGVFNIILTDAGTQVTAPTPQINDLKQAFQGENRYLGITVTHGPDGDINAPEISPRQRMVSSPFAFHAQNATDAFHAEQADGAALAKDSEKLGGTAASEFYDNARFDLPGLSSDYKTLLGWTSGGIAGATKLYDYAGNFCMADSPTQPDSGVKFLVKDGKLQADDGVIVNGPVRASSGKPNQGLQFPENIGGGSGDKAYLQYYARTGEDCTLELAVENDPGDNLELRASGDVKLKAGSIELRGNVSLFGGISLLYEFTGPDTYTFTASENGFLYINYGGVYFRLYIGDFYSPIRENYGEWRTEFFSVTRGEDVTVKCTDNDMKILKLYWRPVGK